MFPLGQDFRKGNQYEIAQVEAGVGEEKIRRFHDGWNIKKNIDLNGAGGVAGGIL